MADWMAGIRRLARSARVFGNPTDAAAYVLHVPVKPQPREYIRHGYNPEIDTVAVDLRDVTAEDRDLLAGYYESAVADDWNRVSVLAATPEAVLDAIRAMAERAAERDREYAQEREKVLQEARDVVLERRIRTEINYLKVGTNEPEAVSYETIVPDWPAGVAGVGNDRVFLDWTVPVEDVIRETGATSWVSELAARNKQRRRAAEEDHRRKGAEQEAKYEEGMKTLCRWAQTRSDGLPIIDDKRSGWARRLENLWIDANAPEGYDRLHPVMVIFDNENPTSQELKALADAKEICDGVVVSDARLGLVRAKNARPEKTRRMVGLTLTAPTGYHRGVWRHIERDS